MGRAEGDTVGEGVTGLSDGEFVGSSVVGLALGLFDGDSVTGLFDGDNVGEDVTELVVGLNVGGFVTGEIVGDEVEIGDVGQNSRCAGVISSCVYDVDGRDRRACRREIKKVYVRHAQKSRGHLTITVEELRDTYKSNPT